MVCWFAGLFYLPRLFVYHAMADDRTGIERFKIMERKLYFGIATPNAILTLIFGFWLISYHLADYMQMPWMHLKLTLVALLLAYHIYLGKLLFALKADRSQHSHRFYRFINEIPVFFLIAIIILVVVQPTFHLFN
jgi:putative membrane protein